MRFFAVVIVFLASIALPPSASAAEQSSASTSDGRAATAFVRAFFAAFDARDMVKLRESFVDDAMIVHDNGVVTDVPKLMDIVRRTREWPPRSRVLSDFVVTRAAGATLVLCLNKVRFTPAGRAPVESLYRETWVLVPTPSGLKAARSHYSAVTREEHTEDVP